MSGRRVGGRFVTHSEAEIYQRALVAPAVNWKQEWVTPSGLSSDSKYKVRKWVKSSTPQEFSDESDQEDVQELYANNSAPTMALPPKPVVAGAPPTPGPDAAAAAAVSAEAGPGEPDASEVKQETTAMATDVKPKAEDAEMTAVEEPSTATDPTGQEEAKPPAPVAEPTDLAAAAPMLPPSLIPESTANVNLAPPPLVAASLSSTAPPPSSPLSPAASSPAAPSSFPSAAAAAGDLAPTFTVPPPSTSEASAPPPPPAPVLTATALAGQEDLTALPGQAHSLPGVEGGMALVGEDGSDPRSEGARIGMGVPAAGPEPMDQDEPTR